MSKLPTVKQRSAQSLKNCEMSLAARKKEFEAGDKSALLAAINNCANYNVALPPWAAEAFKAAYREAAYDHLHNSWNAVFGSPNPLKVRAATVAKYRKYDPQIWNLVNASKSSVPQVFEEVASKLGIGAKFCEQRFYAFKNFYFGDAETLYPRSYAKAKNK